MNRIDLAARSPASLPLHDLMCQARGIFLDWDGCVAIGNRVEPGATRLIARHADRVAILSNNSTHLPEDFAAILHSAGLSIPPERIVLAGVEAVRAAVARRPRRVLMFGSPRIRGFAHHEGLHLVREDPDLILLMRDTRFTFAKLERAANALHRGVPLLVANADRTHPGTDGRIVPETGALLAALAACAPAAAVTIVGKPGPTLFARACAVLGIARQDAVMIGDNAETDIRGAEDFGMRSLLIGGAGGVTLDALAGG